MAQKSQEPQSGDKVEVHFSKEIYEGVLLESPEDESGTILLKLDSGYNIGLNKKDAKEIKILEKAETKEEQKLELKQDENKPNLAVIFTGGTIASQYDPETGAVKWLTNPENLFKFYPEIFDIANVSKVEVPFMKGSENIDSKDWKKLAKTVKESLNDKNIEGVIVTHGTDTAHYTSAALSFFLRGKEGSELNKPVVLTYSQRSVDRASSDANLNLKCAAKAATSDIAEIMLVGHSSENDDFCYALPGTKVRKLHSSRRDAFEAVNSKPIAKIYPNEIERISYYNLRNEKSKVQALSKFDENVALLKFYPGQDPVILDYYAENYKGVVIEALGLGQIATSEARKSWTAKLKEAINKGLTVCLTSQTIFGRVDPYVYSTGRELLNTGAIFLEDMHSETAFVKLGWVLGNENWSLSHEGIKQKMLENVAGEFNDRLEE
ncbi:MAG: Glu-tRNA(Gln) amidotransferase subunit GatD [Candidatus Pacearchaeota archaeon]